MILQCWGEIANQCTEMEREKQLHQLGHVPWHNLSDEVMRDLGMEAQFAGMGTDMKRTMDCSGGPACCARERRNTTAVGAWNGVPSKTMRMQQRVLRCAQDDN